MKSKTLVVLATAVLCGQAFAQVDLHDFEQFAPTSGAQFNPNHPGSLQAFTLVGMCTNIIIRRVSVTGAPATFDIHDHTNWGPFPPSWGNRSLNPFTDDQQGAFWLEFTSPVQGFSLEYGDFGGDLDIGQMWAYDGVDNTSNLVDTDVDNYGAGAFPGSIGTLAVSGASIRSVYFIAGSSSFPHSAYYDNFRVRCVPEPATMAALGLGLLAVTRRRKKS